MTKELRCTADCVRTDIRIPRRRRGDRGSSLVETLTACTVLAVGAYSAMACLTGSAALDDELREQSTALRAASARATEILAYDHHGDITNLVAYWSDPARASFDVAGLARPSAAANAESAVGAPVGATPSCGTILIDAADLDRVTFTVDVTWSGRKGARSLQLPVVVTEIK